MRPLFKGLTRFYTYIFLLLAYVITVLIFSKNATHIPYGDGPEYVLMTESFYNHFSPDLRNEDGQKYINYLDKKNLFVHKLGEFEKASRVENGNDWVIGYFQSLKNNKRYSYHFWMYSIVNLPSRFILDHIKGDIRISFLMTNLFLIFLGMGLILSITAYTKYQRLILALFLAFSSALWYIDWAHAEVFLGVLVFLGVVYYAVGKKYWALFLFSFSATQNQVLFIPAAFIFIAILFDEKISLKVLFKLFFASFWIILPPVFYYYHFDTFSMISKTGTLSWDVVSFRRLFDFFFDLNQGAILGLPIALPVLLFFLLSDAIRKKWRREYWFIVSMLLMSILFMQVLNWNEGNAVIKRYAVWCNSILLAVLFTRIVKIQTLPFYVISILIIGSQILAIFSQQDYDKAYWHSAHHNQLARWVLNNYPSWYNPEPSVFLARNNPHSISTTDSVVVYADPNNTITKMMVKKGSIGQLVKRGIDKDDVHALEEQLKYHNGYAYINKRDLDLVGYNQSEDALIKFIDLENERKIKEGIENTIYNDPNWLSNLKKQAIEWELPLDSVVRLNVNYVFEQGKKAKNQ